MIVKYILFFAYEKSEGGASSIKTRIYTDDNIDNLCLKALQSQRAHANAFDYLYSNAAVVFAVTKNLGKYDIAEKPEYYAYYNGLSEDMAYKCRNANVTKVDGIRKLVKERGEVI